MKKTKGFTLVELMVVIVIIGILAALAIPKFMGATNKTKVAEFKPVLKQMVTLQQSYKEEKNNFSKDKSGAEIGFSAPANVDKTTKSAVEGSSRFEYEVQDGTVGGIMGDATPVSKTAGVLKDMDGKPLVNGTDFGCADSVSIFSVSSAAFGTVSNLAVNTNCKASTLTDLSAAANP